MYGIIKSDDKVFAGDKIRFDVSKSFFDAGETPETTSHEISFDAGATWLNISSDLYADKVYTTSGEKTVTLRLTKTGNVTATFTKTVIVLVLADAKLFSTDSDLYTYEPEIDSNLPERWSSWNLVHLRAQSYIMDWLNERGYKKNDGTKYAVADLLDRDEVKQFSIAKTLELIFHGNANIAGDISTIKRDKYAALAAEKSTIFELSLNASGNADDTTQKTNMHVIGVSRK